MSPPTAVRRHASTRGASGCSGRGSAAASQAACTASTEPMGCFASGATDARSGRAVRTGSHVPVQRQVPPGIGRRRRGRSGGATARLISCSDGRTDGGATAGGRPPERPRTAARRRPGRPGSASVAARSALCATAAPRAARMAGASVAASRAAHEVGGAIRHRPPCRWRRSARPCPPWLSSCPRRHPRRS